MMNRLISILCLLVTAVTLSPSARGDDTQVIKLWHQMIYSHREVLRNVADEFEKTHPNVEVQLTYRETEELRSAYQSAAMGGSGPDLVYGPSDQVGPFAEMGIIRPLESLVSDGFIDQFDPNAVIRYQDHIYMVGNKVGNYLMLIYNKDLLPEPPRNTDEMIEIGKKFTQDTNGDGVRDTYGLVWNFTEPFFYVPWINGFGDEWFFTEDNRPNLNTEANIAGFRFMKDLIEKHKIVPKESDYEMANALFKQGKAPMIINGDWSWGDFKKAGVNFGIARIPMVSETGRWPSPLVSTQGYSVNVNVEEDKLPLVMEFFRYLNSAEIQRRFAQEVNVYPSHLEVRQSPLIQGNELLEQSAKIMEVGRPMPVVPELRAVWDALRTQYQAVLGGMTPPDEAARLAQVNAERQIRQMNQTIQPNWQAYVVWAAFILLALGAVVFLVRHTKSFIQGFWGPQKLAYLMMAPAYLAIFSVIVYPFFYNVAISFSNLNLQNFHDWQIVGFQHYLSVLVDPKFYSVLIKTLIWTSVNIFFHVTIGIILALLINQTLPGKPLMRVLLIIPWAVPQYITALTWRGMFNQEYGAINIILGQLFHVDPIQWLSQPFEAFVAVILTNIWLGFPFMMVVALGGLQAIPHEMYEAAKIDGANAWQRFWNITWPMLKPVMLPSIVLGAVWTFNNLNVVWLVSNSGEPADQTHILVSYVYKAVFNLYRYGYGAALSMIIFLMLLAFGVIFLNRTKASESIY